VTGKSQRKIDGKEMVGATGFEPAMTL